MVDKVFFLQIGLVMGTTDAAMLDIIELGCLKECEMARWCVLWPFLALNVSHVTCDGAVGVGSGW